MLRAISSIVVVVAVCGAALFWWHRTSGPEAVLAAATERDEPRATLVMTTFFGELLPGLRAAAVAYEQETGVRPILSVQRTPGRGRILPLEFFSFTVAPDKLEQRFAGTRRNVVLQGRRTAIVQAGTIPIGRITTTTTVRLKLLAST